MSFINPKIDVLKAEDYKDLSIKDKAELGFKQGKLWHNYNLKDTLITTAGVGAAAGTAAAVAKSKTAQNAIMKVLNKAKNSGFVKTAGESLKSISAYKYVQKAANWVKGLPPAAKAAGAGVLALVRLIKMNNRNRLLEKNGALIQQTIDVNKAKKNIKE